MGTPTKTFSWAWSKPGDLRLGDITRVRKLDDPSAPKEPSIPFLKKLAIIGFPSDEGVARNQGRTGAKRGPEVFRSHMKATGPLLNPEFGIDLTELLIEDFGDVEPIETLEHAHAALTGKVRQALHVSCCCVRYGISDRGVVRGIYDCRKASFRSWWAEAAISRFRMQRP